MVDAGLTVRKASASDLALVVPLFDGYRVFYGKPSQPEEVRTFLAQRFALADSTIFIALHGERAVGFTQLYPSLSSVSMARIEILNDLFVDASARGLGAGRALLQAAKAHGREVGAVRLVLSTAHTNTGAQALYESDGWVLDRDYRSYEFALRP